MKNWRNAVLLLALVAYVILLWMWASFGYPSEYQVCNETNPAHVNCPAHYLVFVPFWFFAEYHEPLTAIGALALAVFAFFQFIETRKSSQRQLRAYISVESGNNFRQSKRRRTIFEFRPWIINNGQTPANEVRIISLIDVVTPHIPTVFNYAISPVHPLTGNPLVGNLASVTTIGPRQNRFHSRIVPRNLTVQEMRELLKGTKCFHLWGSVTYRDIFDAPQYTNFSFIIFVGNKRSQTVWNNTEHHNDAS